MTFEIAQAIMRTSTTVAGCLYLYLVVSGRGIATRLATQPIIDHQYYIPVIVRHYIFV